MNKLKVIWNPIKVSPRVFANYLEVQNEFLSLNTRKYY